MKRRAEELRVLLVLFAACGRSALDDSSFVRAGTVDSGVSLPGPEDGPRPPGSDAAVDGSASDATPSEAACPSSMEKCSGTNPEVTGGTYYRTYVNLGDFPGGLADPATVSAFRLDPYDVTVGRFRPFVKAWDGGAGYLPPPGSGKHSHLNGGKGLASVQGGFEAGWDAADDGNVVPTDANLQYCDGASDYATWTPAAGQQEGLPINCVTWQEAYAFCIWDGGFLPSEAEWEYAAAGGSAQREYPWGSSDPGTRNLFAIYGCYYPDQNGACAGVGNIAPVGTADSGAGRWGQLDLAGEVWQWTLDAYASGYTQPCVDCARVAPAPARVLRGGDFFFGVDPLSPSYRNFADPMSRVRSVGFRCARAQ